MEAQLRKYVVLGWCSSTSCVVILYIEITDEKILSLLITGL